MKLIITALIAFAFLTTPVFAGERSFDMNNAFSYSESTQSPAGSGGSAGGAAKSGSATVAIVVFVILTIVLFAVTVDTGTFKSGSS